MRVAVMMLGLALGVAVTAVAGDIYRWADSKGNLHFSNVPTGAGDQTTVIDEEQAPPLDTASATQESGAPAAETEEQAGVSAQASLRRQELEREFRQTEAQVHAIDKQLADTASLRTRFAKGTEMTGGLGTRAENVRTPEEEQLAAKREQLTKHAGEIKGEYDKLGAEVSRTFGGTPDWWVDLR